MAYSARPLGEKPWESIALQNSQGRGAKRSLPLWQGGQLRRMLAQPSHHWQKSGTSELLVPCILDLPNAEESAQWLPLLLQALSCEIRGLAKSLQAPQAKGDHGHLPPAPDLVHKRQTECPL